MSKFGTRRKHKLKLEKTYGGKWVYDRPLGQQYENPDKLSLMIFIVVCAYMIVFSLLHLLQNTLHLRILGKSFETDSPSVPLENIFGCYAGLRSRGHLVCSKVPAWSTAYSVDTVFYKVLLLYHIFSYDLWSRTLVLKVISNCTVTIYRELWTVVTGKLVSRFLAAGTNLSEIIFPGQIGAYNTEFHQIPNETNKWMNE